MTVTEFYRALVGAVKLGLQAHDLPSTPVMASDLSEPITRPSVKIMLDEVRAERATTYQNLKYAVVHIYYFPADRQHWRAAHWAMQEALTDALMDGVQVDDLRIYPEDGISFDAADGVLIGTQSYAWYEDRITHETEDPMESLSINLL